MFNRLILRAMAHPRSFGAGFIMFAIGFIALVIWTLMEFPNKTTDALQEEPVGGPSWLAWTGSVCLVLGCLIGMSGALRRRTEQSDT